MSTYAVLDILDSILFTENLAAGIVSYSLEHAQHIYKRIIGHALETLLPEIKSIIGIKSQSTREITLDNGSFLRVDTSLRGGTYQAILASEFGKVCSRSSQKSEEVITGTLQAVASTGSITIESTGEGNSGYFADMCRQAHIRGEPQNNLDYELFFFPWYTEAAYRLDKEVKYDTDLEDYFNGIEILNAVKIDQGQRWWYAQQKVILNEKIKQEFPSTINEAFLSSSDAYYYAQLIEDAYNDDRCVSHDVYDALHPVYVSMDIGINDLTVIVFFQVIHGEIRCIDYYEDMNKGVDFYARFLLQDKPYLYNTIFLPHDAKQRSKVYIENVYEREFRRLFQGTATRFHVLERKDVNLLISNAKQKMKRCVFVLKKMKKFIEHLGKYRKKWHEPTGRYLDEPLHDIHSNHADAFKYLAQAVDSLEALTTLDGAMAKHKEAIAMRKDHI